jgi:hypothetical protein
MQSLHFSCSSLRDEHAAFRSLHAISEIAHARHHRLCAAITVVYVATIAFFVAAFVVDCALRFETTVSI